MRELSPGLWHWIASHPQHGMDVSSYYLADERVAIDPLLPPEGLDWFASIDAPPRHVLLSNRHHDRHAWRLQEAFGCEVHCIASGAHELEGRGDVSTFEIGDELPGAIVVHEVGAICPDETALHIPRHDALAVADGVVRWPGVEGLTFVPDWLMDEPEQTRRRLRDAYQELLELDFDRLLLAHGEPVCPGGHDALRTFAEA